ncbi:MAG: AAA family ATPase [Nocardioidaceae bacterium]
MGTPQTRLITLRGNSGSGKTSVGRSLQESLPRGHVALLSQDVVRRETLRTRDVVDNPAIDLLNVMARYTLDRGISVVIEGMLQPDRYGPMRCRLVDDHEGVSRSYLWDLPFEETVRKAGITVRHKRNTSARWRQMRARLHDRTRRGAGAAGAPCLGPGPSGRLPGRVRSAPSPQNAAKRCLSLSTDAGNHPRTGAVWPGHGSAWPRLAIGRVEPSLGIAPRKVSDFQLQQDGRTSIHDTVRLPGQRGRFSTRGGRLHGMDVIKDGGSLRCILRAKDPPMQRIQDPWVPG